MKQQNDLLGVRIDASEVRAFVTVTAMTGPGEVLEDGLAAMLAGDDVLEVEWLKRRRPIRQVAVLAAPARALANLLTNRLAHLLSRARPASAARPSGARWR